MQPKKEMILQVEQLNIKFTSYTKGLHQKTTQAIHGLSAHIEAGEILAVAGASGSGKSLLAHALLGILPTNSSVDGLMKYKEQEMTKDRIKQLRGTEIAFIPQSISCLNPLMKVGTFAGKQACGLFSRYGLSKEVEKLYPHELSGGMARRVLIACAASTDADLIIADEPTAGLNEGLAHETMKHLRELADEGRAVLLITHDLYLASQYVERVTILNEGRTVETLSITALKAGQWQEKFTEQLWMSLPENDFWNNDIKEIGL
ncbi:MULTISPECIES: ATP-binding cassette domain-containing protein [Bacillus]|uniref:ATP-binding cassette domain-containing protein n=1 Tax=Bacillus TaxID=1386 RepID=UPI0002EE263C|nr:MULTISPECIES: ATP-binding cassette domain-containing protein [Bacillus]